MVPGGTKVLLRSHPWEDLYCCEWQLGCIHTELQAGRVVGRLRGGGGGWEAYCVVLSRVFRCVALVSDHRDTWLPAAVWRTLWFLVPDKSVAKAVPKSSWTTNSLTVNKQESLPCCCWSDRFDVKKCIMHDSLKRNRSLVWWGLGPEGKQFLTPLLCTCTQYINRSIHGGTSQWLKVWARPPQPLFSVVNSSGTPQFTWTSCSLFCLWGLQPADTAHLLTALQPTLVAPAPLMEKPQIYRFFLQRFKEAYPKFSLHLIKNTTS